MKKVCKRRKGSAAETVIVFCTILLILITGVLRAPVICHAEVITSDLIAGEDERTTVEDVGREGMTPVYAADIREGTYEIEVDSSSSMFRIEDARLTVADGAMTAVLTLSGTGYLKLFMGTGEQAVAADESAYIPYVEDEEGKYTYTVPVEALDQELECTAFSRRKEKWYDHQIVFEAATLPEDALLIELTGGEPEDDAEADAASGAAKAEQTDGMQAAEGQDQKAPSDAGQDASGSAGAAAMEFDMEDGVYLIDVSLSGGTGRVSIASPAKMTVWDQKATARIEWSSSSYDYMMVNGEQYLPVNTEGNSVFEIPVLALDEAFAVSADTTAMSTPHEIEYTLTFDSASIRPGHGGKASAGAVAVVAVVIAAAAVAVVIVILNRKKKNNADR